MKVTQPELIEIIDEVTTAVGQILLTHLGLTESMLDQTQARLSKEKIERLKKEIDAEHTAIAIHKDQQKRKQDLEKLRSHQDTTNKEKSKQNEGKHSLKTIQILDGSGKLIGWIQPVSSTRTNILNSKGVIVAREVDGKTFDRNGKFMGRGFQGLRVLGMNQRN